MRHVTKLASYILTLSALDATQKYIQSNFHKKATTGCCLIKGQSEDLSGRNSSF